MNKEFSSDKPIFQEIDDKFQRFDFSKRIAQTVIDRNDKDCIVIGIYGAWGEGKTSVLNFIESELKKSEDIITVKFNPWRYNDENALLIHFFQTLASTLDKSLKTKKEKLGDLLKKYGSLVTFDVPMIGNLGEKLKAGGEILAEVDIETLKDRIEQILEKTNNKIVIFIDDIDRLDKIEIHSIFRLVKLTADFSHTVYLLAFDEEMVSAAIGDRFGAGNQSSGQNFLEKIIQVPLKIPTAQPSALQQFCFDMLNKAISSHNISLTENEIKRYASEFSNNVLVKLNTPRLAVRYGNSLSFSLPILYGEVNTVDLMLIEAVKIFYPKHYEFVKLNPDFFIGSYSHGFNNGKNTDKINLFKEQLQKIDSNLSSKQKKCIESLLQELFPVLKEVFQNYTFSVGANKDWFKNQRIASPKYFNKFFSYTVLKGEISDVAFKEFILRIPTQEDDTSLFKELKGLVELSSANNFLLKLRTLEEELTWETSVKLSQIIAANSNIFPKPTGFSFGFDSNNGQAVIFIIQLIKAHNDKEDQFELVKLLFLKAKPLEFAFELNYELRRKDSESEHFFSDKEYQDINQILIKRALEEANPDPIFIKYPTQTEFLFEEWAKLDKAGLLNYVKNIMKNNPEMSIDLLRSYTPTIISTAQPNPFKSNFSKESYQSLTSLFDNLYINKLIKKVISESEINAENPKWIERGEVGQTDLNIVRQYFKLQNEE